MDIEEHISNLKQYIKDDEIIEKDRSDFANFCKGHIDDIQAVLNELEKKDKVIDLLDEIYAEINNLKTNSIPISVIQNKIDELKHRKSKNAFEFACNLKGILYLQELLEERNK